MKSCTWRTWFEEFGHALQYLKYGNVELSIDGAERRNHEIEVANCLMENAGHFRLSTDDVAHCQATISAYEGISYGD